LAVHRYKTPHFEGYFLGARAVLDIFLEIALVMESGRKNEGFILHLLMQFNGCFVLVSIVNFVRVVVYYHVIN
jgi:hypothetical protein